MKPIIEMICTDMCTEQEKELLRIVQSYGFNIDRTRLMAALIDARRFYNEGYEDGRHSSRWISVEERLPDGEVLAANFAPGTYGYKEYIIGYVYVVKGFEPDYVKGKCYASNDFEILNNVTHWMPLPEPPEMKEE